MPTSTLHSSQQSHLRASCGAGSLGTRRAKKPHHAGEGLPRRYPRGPWKAEWRVMHVTPLLWGGSLGCRSSRITRFCSKKERAVKAETGELGWGKGSVWEATNLV